MTDLLPCPFCGSEIKHIGSWAKSFDPPRLYHEWHHVKDNEAVCPIRQRGKIIACATDDVVMQDDAINRWNNRTATPAQPVGMLGRENDAFHRALRKYPDAFEALHSFWNDAFAAQPPAAPVETYTEICKSPHCPRGGVPVEIVGSAVKAMQDRNLAHPGLSAESPNVDVLIQRLRAANAGGLREQAYQSLCGDAADALSLMTAVPQEVPVPAETEHQYSREKLEGILANRWPSVFCKEGHHGTPNQFAKNLVAFFGSHPRAEIPTQPPAGGALERDPALFDILNSALGTMHYHRLMGALNSNGYVITRGDQVK